MAFNCVGKPFGEDALGAVIRRTEEAPDSELDPDRYALPRKIGDLTLVAAVNSPRSLVTCRTATLLADWPQNHHQPAQSFLHFVQRHFSGIGNQRLASHRPDRGSQQS